MASSINVKMDPNGTTRQAADVKRNESAWDESSSSSSDSNLSSTVTKASNITKRTLNATLQLREGTRSVSSINSSERSRRKNSRIHDKVGNNYDIKYQSKAEYNYGIQILSAVAPQAAKGPLADGGLTFGGEDDEEEEPQPQGMLAALAPMKLFGALTSAPEEEGRKLHTHPPNLYDVFAYEDKTSAHLSKNFYDDAFSAAKTKFKVGKDLFYARSLVSFFVISVLSKHGEKALEIRQEILRLITKSINVTGSDLRSFGSYLRNHGKHIEAVLFHLISADLSIKHSKGDQNVISAVLACCVDLVTTTKAMVKVEEFRARYDFRSLVKHQILTLFDVFQVKIQGLDSVDKDKRVSSEANVLGCVAFIQHDIGDNVSSADTCVSALKTLEVSIPYAYHKFRVYGALQHGLGNAYFALGRFSEAASKYQAAIKYKELAENFASEDERKASIELSRHWLSDANNRKAGNFTESNAVVAWPCNCPANVEVVGPRQICKAMTLEKDSRKLLRPKINLGL